MAFPAHGAAGEGWLQLRALESCGEGAPHWPHAKEKGKRERDKPSFHIVFHQLMHSGERGSCTGCWAPPGTGSTGTGFVRAVVAVPEPRCA